MEALKTISLYWIKWASGSADSWLKTRLIIPSERNLPLVLGYGDHWKCTVLIRLGGSESVALKLDNQLWYLLGKCCSKWKTCFLQLLLIHPSRKREGWHKCLHPAHAAFHQPWLSLAIRFLESSPDSLILEVWQRTRNLSITWETVRNVVRLHLTP